MTILWLTKQPSPISVPAALAKPIPSHPIPIPNPSQFQYQSESPLTEGVIITQRRVTFMLRLKALGHHHQYFRASQALLQATTQPIRKLKSSFQLPVALCQISLSRALSAVVQHEVSTVIDDMSPDWPPEQDWERDWERVMVCPPRTHLALHTLRLTLKLRHATVDCSK